MKSLPAMILILVSTLAGAACSSEPQAKPDAQYKKEVTSGLYGLIAKDIDQMATASLELQALALVPSGRGWDAAADRAGIEAMRAAWAKVRAPYERIEGAVAPLFGELDESMDQRYDTFVTEVIPDAKGDADLFDDQGVTGMHAIERVLWSDSIPQSVIDAEKALTKDGKSLYVAAAFPRTAAEAQSFKEKLCGKLVTDVRSLQEQWKGAAKLDIAFAFGGLQSLMNEQSEKVSRAAAGREESRYSQRTMADLRENLAGTRAAYQIFRPYLLSKSGASAASSGSAIDGKITSGFQGLNDSYDAVRGDAIPVPPSTWKAEDGLKQSDADIKTAFGALFSAVTGATSEETEGSVAQQMSQASKTLGFASAK
jgi:iron uptake system component EfeO